MRHRDQGGGQAAGAGRGPSPPRLIWEAGVVVDLAKGLLRLPRRAATPRGGGEPVMVLPGFGTGDRATSWLRRRLRRLGYDARAWELGRNGGNVPALIPRVVARTEALAGETGRPVRLVGWSLGGNLAREVARERPDLVDRVITLGTPVVGGPKYTVAAGAYRRRGYDLDAIEAYVAERNRALIRVPITAIYSRRDGVVSWRACLDPDNPDVEHVEVRCSHFGLLFAPEVLHHLAQRLAPA